MSLLQEQLARHNLRLLNIGWDDAARCKGSSLGKNISDWTFTHNGKLLQFIRHDNFTDRTLTMPCNKLAVVVGNETYGKPIYPVTLYHYLKNFGKFNPGFPPDLDLSNGEEEPVSVRFIAVVVPDNGEITPTCYSYQTYNNNDPRNYITVSHHQGSSSSTDTRESKPIYLVKTNPDGTRDNTTIKITSEEEETKDELDIDPSVLGTRSTGVGKNRVMCLQIPRKMDNGPIFRCLSAGNVSYGSNMGRYQVNSNIKHGRENTQHPTMTLAFYFTSPDIDNLTDEEVSYMAKTIEGAYGDPSALWDGSITTGQSYNGDDTEAPIKAPLLTKEDLEEIKKKVAEVPPPSLCVFPE
ncbi:MAG: hypothetical protein ACR2M9_04440 [Cyanophyceae cyanobacterium]